MKKMTFTVADDKILELDLIRERCGLDTYGQAVAHAVALYAHLTQRAADGEEAVFVQLSDAEQVMATTSISQPTLTRAYTSAREAERALLPSAPAPVAPCPTPASARPWWQFWSRA